MLPRWRVFRAHAFNVYHSPRLIVYALCLIALLTVLNICGIYDHLVSVDFDADFRWPPYVNVQEQVASLLAQQAPSVEPVNKWDDKVIHIPSRWTCPLVQQILIAVKSRAVANDVNRRRMRMFVFNRMPAIVTYAFVIGRSTDSEEEVHLQSEIDSEGDVLQFDFVDAYRNNTRKVFNALNYIDSSKCLMEVSHILFIDDDYWLNLRNLLRLVEQRSNQESLYEGYRFDTRPFRGRLMKHYTSIHAYPFNKYPPYISAGAILLNRRTAQRMLYASRFLQIYPFDDIYIALIAHLLRIQPIHNEHMHFWPTTYDQQTYHDAICSHEPVDIARAAADALNDNRPP